MTAAFIGQPVSRIDGRQKVTGSATYAAEFDVSNVAHGSIVRSTIANGRITSIDSTAAELAPGVIAILTHRNAPRLAYREHHAQTEQKSQRHGGPTKSRTPEKVDTFLFHGCSGRGHLDDIGAHDAFPSPLYSGERGGGEGGTNGRRLSPGPGRRLQARMRCGADFG